MLRAAWVALDAGDNDSVVEPLSERELDVLRRVAASYFNQEITQDLVGRQYH